MLCLFHIFDVMTQMVLFTLIVFGKLNNIICVQYTLYSVHTNQTVFRWFIGMATQVALENVATKTNHTHKTASKFD